MGKTFVAALLTHYVTDGLGQSCLYCKPVQTGSTERRDTDEEVIRHHNPSPFLVTMTVLSYKSPVSPHLAASREGLSIHYPRLLRRLRRPSKEAWQFYEGAGGIYVPLTRKRFILDLIEDMKWPVILVGRAGLGTLNHTLLSVDVLEGRRIPIAMIILSCSMKDEVKSDLVRDNARIIGSHTSAPITILKWKSPWNHPWPGFPPIRDKNSRRSGGFDI